MRPRVSTEEGRPVAPRGGPTRGPVPDPHPPPREARGRRGGRGRAGADPSPGMGRGNPCGSEPDGRLGLRGVSLPAQAPLDELDAPDPRRPRTHGGGLTDPRGLQGVDRSVREARWGLRARGVEDEPPLHRGEHGPRPRRVRVRGRSAGAERLRVAPHRPGGVRGAGDLGVEFSLQRELHKQGDHYEPWYRFHHPVHYYYDLLVGLELVTALGRGADPRLGHALSVLKRKRRADGRWNLDAVHPDLEGKMADWYAAHPKHRPTPFALEAPGEPSKIITLRAYLVLERLDETASP